MKPILSPELSPAGSSLAALTSLYAADEGAHLTTLLEQARVDPDAQAAIQKTAEALVLRVRAKAEDQGAIEAFMFDKPLSSSN